MTILSLPPKPDFTDTRFGLVSNTQSDLTSPVTQSSQLLEMPGARWRAAYALPPMSRMQAAAWQAFGMRLRGRAGWFYGFDPDARRPRGSARHKEAGSLTIAAGSPGPSGSLLIVEGAEAMQPGVFLAGDYIAYDVGPGRQLHMVVADANADSSGEMSIAIEPPIRRSPDDGGAVIFTEASCTMRLVDDEFGWDASRISRYGIRFEAIEVFA